MPLIWDERIGAYILVDQSGNPVPNENITGPNDSIRGGQRGNYVGFMDKNTMPVMLGGNSLTGRPYGDISHLNTPPPYNGGYGGGGGTSGADGSWVAPNVMQQGSRAMPQSAQMPNAYQMPGAFNQLLQETLQGNPSMVGQVTRGGTSTVDPTVRAPGAPPPVKGQSIQDQLSNRGSIYNKIPQVEQIDERTGLPIKGGVVQGTAPTINADWTPTPETRSGNTGGEAPRVNPNQGAEQFPEGIRAWAMAYKQEHGYFPGQAPQDINQWTQSNQYQGQSRASQFPEQMTEWGDVQPWYQKAQQYMGQQSPNFRQDTDMRSFAADLAVKQASEQMMAGGAAVRGGRTGDITPDEWQWLWKNTQGISPQ